MLKIKAISDILILELNFLRGLMLFGELWDAHVQLFSSYAGMLYSTKTSLIVCENGSLASLAVDKNSSSSDPIKILLLGIGAVLRARRKHDDRIVTPNPVVTHFPRL